MSMAFTGKDTVRNRATSIKNIHCADKWLLISDPGLHTTIISLGQVVKQSLQTSSGSGTVITVTEAQNEVRRVLQVADKFLSAAGDSTSSNVGASCTISIMLRIGPCWLDGAIRCFACVMPTCLRGQMFTRTSPTELTATRKHHKRGLQHIADLERVYEHTCLPCCQICPDTRSQAAVPGKYRGCSLVESSHFKGKVWKLESTLR